MIRSHPLFISCVFIGCHAAPLDVISRSDDAVTGGQGGSAGNHGSGGGGAAGTVMLPAEVPRFEEPRLIEALSDPGPDDDPSLTTDLRELYFSSSRGGGEDIYVSVRESPSDPWGAPTPVAELNSDYIDATPGVAPDGLTIWFESTRTSEDLDLLHTDIWTATRPDRTSAWSAPTLVAELSTETRDSAPLPSSRLVMTFSAWRDPGVGDTDVYVTVRTSPDAPWGPASLLREVSSDDWDQGLLRAEGTQIFLSSGRNTEIGRGNFFWAARPIFGAAFAEPLPITDLNTDAEDQDIWISEALDYAVFASSRSGNVEIYEANIRP